MNFSFGTNYALPNLSLKSDAGVVTGNVIHGEVNEPPSICTKVGGVFFIVVIFFQTEASSQLVIHKTLGISWISVLVFFMRCFVYWRGRAAFLLCEKVIPEAPRHFRCIQRAGCFSWGRNYCFVKFVSLGKLPLISRNGTPSLVRKIGVINFLHDWQTNVT